MSKIIEHYFNNEEKETDAPNGPIRSLTRQYFGGVSVEDQFISPVDFAPVPALSVSTQPAATLTLAEGATATIGPVAATGGYPAYAYQWYKNGAIANNSSATTNTYVSGNLAAADDGAKYHCVITDSEGQTVTTNDCTVTVTPTS